MKTTARFLVLPLLFFSTLASAQQLYRFKVDGRMQLKDHIPSEYSHLGYEVLNKQGRVIEVVPPAPTASELARLKVEQEKKELRQQEVKRQTEQDQLLLRLYSGPADVRLLQQRKQQETESYIAMQNRQIDDFQQKLNRILTELAEYERKKQKAPADLHEEKVRMQASIKNNQSNIRKREVEDQESLAVLQQQHLRMQILQFYAPGTLEDEVDMVRLQQRFAD